MPHAFSHNHLLTCPLSKEDWLAVIQLPIEYQITVCRVEQKINIENIGSCLIVNSGSFSVTLKSAGFQDTRMYQRLNVVICSRPTRLQIR